MVAAALRSMPIDTEYFGEHEGQFLVAGEERSLELEATRHKIGPIFVDIFRGAKTVEAYDKSGQPVGLFIGTLIDTDREVIIEHQVLFDAEIRDVKDIDQFVEKQVYRFAGTFLFILNMLGQRRIYLDANGTKSVVYDPVERVAAATTSLLLAPEDYQERFRADLYFACGVDGDGWFTAGLTAHRGIQRLLCNHYLDLDSWKPVRHWSNEHLAESANPDEEIATITEEVKRAIRALTKDRGVSVALTAGNETRLLLSCCRDLLRKVTFVTVAAPGAALEVARAKELASRFGLNHQILPYVKANQSQVGLWERRTSHCLSGANKTMHPSVAPLDGRVFIGGLGGEIGRGFLWLQSERSDAMDAVEIMDRLKLARHPDVLAAVKEWLHPLEHYDALAKLDLAYMELRMSCWGFADSYALPKQLEIHPLISRRIYRAMLALPADVRRNNGMTLLCINREWPEVLTLPINRYGDLRDRMVPLRRAIANPRRAMRKVRQLGLVAFRRALARLPMI
jgi:hypothetical protein